LVPNGQAKEHSSDEPPQAAALNFNPMDTTKPFSQWSVLTEKSDGTTSRINVLSFVQELVNRG